MVTQTASINGVEILLLPLLRQANVSLLEFFDDQGIDNIDDILCASKK